IAGIRTQPDRRAKHLIAHIFHNPADHGFGCKHERGDGSCVLQSRASHLGGIDHAAFTRSSYRSVEALKPKFGSSLALIFSTTTAPSVSQFSAICRTGSS